MKTIQSMPSIGPDLSGVVFISGRHANPVLWTAIRYHRNGDWVCQEAAHNTTCHFHHVEIQAWAIGRK